MGEKGRLLVRLERKGNICKMVAIKFFLPFWYFNEGKGHIVVKHTTLREEAMSERHEMDFFSSSFGLRAEKGPWISAVIK